MAKRRGRVVLSSDSSSSDDEDKPSKPSTQKSDLCNAEVPKSVHSMFDTSSSSSSDEFEKAPACLDDMDLDFKKPLESKSAEVATPKKKAVEEEPNIPLEEKPAEYYDFSSILKSQEELKTVAQLMTNYSEKQKEAPTGQNKPQREKKASKPRRGTKKSSKNESAKKSKPPQTENMDIDELLRLGESSENTITAPRRKKRSRDLVDDDMVVVEDDDVAVNDPEVSHDVEIRIALPNMYTMKKKDRDMRHRAEMARSYNETRREFQVDLHKVTLLGCLAHGFYLNDYANSDLALGLAFSVIPSKTFYPPAATTTSYVEKITKWFNKTYPVDDSKSDISVDIVMEDFARKKASSSRCLVVMFVAFCRQLGLKCRLLASLQPRSLKPATSELMRVPKETEKGEDDLFEESPPKKLKPGPSKNSDPPSRKVDSKKLEKSEMPSKSKKSANPKKDSAGKNGQDKKSKANRKVISSDESEEESSTPKSPAKKGMDYWAEVYVECDEIWVPADVVRAQVNNASAIGNGVSKPLMYVVAWNRDNSVKDLTRRYSPHWLTATPKLRVDPAWWKEALDPWAPRNTKLERLENKKLDDEEKACPIPATINDCKNHPFYALQRHLLKFEAIFPPDAKPIGFIRGEAVYSRVCVTELHTKETWMRQGKAVRVNENPYKIVKARPKYDKVSSAVIKDLPLPLFGYWQVDDYIAPPAVGGKVPKNDFGNVELYKPSMLPAGTVHLQVPGMAKVARKLGIDFAPAVVGWEYHSGGSHPVIDGVVVCKEHQDTLVDAWNASVDIDAEKQKSKTRTRAIKNWKKLIRSVIIRKRLEKKYKLDLSNVKSK